MAGRAFTKPMNSLKNSEFLVCSPVTHCSGYTRLPMRNSHYCKMVNTNEIRRRSFYSTEASNTN